MSPAETSDKFTLVESTYEMVGGDDSESYDGNYTESATESVSSLDLPRPDDIHSNGDTEDSREDEYSAIDMADPLLNTELIEAEGDESDGVHPLNTSRPRIWSVSDSEVESSSCGSLDYAQQSLELPSIYLASKVTEAADDPSDQEQAHQKGKKRKPCSEAPSDNFCRILENWNEELSNSFANYATKFATYVLPGLMFAIVYFLLLPSARTPHGPASGVGMRAAKPTGTAAAVVPTTAAVTAVTAATAAAAAAAAVASQGTSDAASLVNSATTQAAAWTTGQNDMHRVAAGEEDEDEWLHGHQKPVVVFTTKSRTEILIRMNSRVKKHWIKRQCLMVTAARFNRSPVMPSVFLAKEGLLARFSKEEAHGSVILTVRSTCRPHVRESVEVEFAMGFLDVTYEISKQMIIDLTKFVPSSAVRASHRLETSARRSFGLAADTVERSVACVSEIVYDKLGPALAELPNRIERVGWEALDRIEQTWSGLLSTCSKSVSTEQLFGAPDAREWFRLRLLDAQIAAKLGWLKATGRMRECDRYRVKARKFRANRRALLYRKMVTRVRRVRSYG